jgi:hypothetical protein
MISGLATVTDAPVSMVTWHGFSCIQPSATSLSSVLVQRRIVLKLFLPDIHGTCTLLKRVFHFVPQCTLFNFNF